MKSNVLALKIQYEECRFGFYNQFDVSTYKFIYYFNDMQMFRYKKKIINTLSQTGLSKMT